MSSGLRIGASAWVAIEPVLVEAVECLSRRLEYLEENKARSAEVVEHVKQILKAAGTSAPAKTGCTSGYSKKEKAEFHKWCKEKLPEVFKRRPSSVDVPTDWRARVSEVSEGNVPPYLADPDWQPDTYTLVELADTDWRPKVDALIDCLRVNKVESVVDGITRILPPESGRCSPCTGLADRRQQAEVKEKAVRGLLDYLRSVLSEQGKAEGGRRRRGRRRRPDADEEEAPTAQAGPQSCRPSRPASPASEDRQGNLRRVAQTDVAGLPGLH